MYYIQRLKPRKQNIGLIFLNLMLFRSKLAQPQLTTMIWFLIMRIFNYFFT